MTPFFDRTGRFVGWLEGETLYDSRRRPRAFLSQDAIFSYRGGHLGFLLGGILRNRDGEAIAFIAGHEPGFASPALPDVPSAPATPPTPDRLPAQPRPESSSVPEGNWSEMTWEVFIDSRN